MRDKVVIKKGIIQPLEKIPYHKKAPLKRILLSGSKFHIAAHIITKLPKKIPKYAEPHAHNCDEIHLILSETGKLIYKITIGDKKHIVSSPAIVYLPKGIIHSAEVVKGKGIYIAIVTNKDYKQSIIKNSNKSK